MAWNLEGDGSLGPSLCIMQKHRQLVGRHPPSNVEQFIRPMLFRCGIELQVQNNRDASNQGHLRLPTLSHIEEAPVLFRGLK